MSIKIGTILTGISHIGIRGIGGNRNIQRVFGNGIRLDFKSILYFACVTGRQLPSGYLTKSGCRNQTK